MSKRNLAERDAKIAELFRQGMPLADIGSSVGLKIGRVSAIAKRDGCEPRHVPGRVCSVDDCGEPHVSCGLCNRHYQRFRKHGTTSPQTPMGRRPSAEIAARDDGIAELYITGIPLAEIAAEFGMKASSISTVARRLGLPPRHLHGLTVCSVNSCQTKHYGRGLCRKHHNRWLKYGDPLAEPPEKRKPGRASRQLGQRQLALNIGGRTRDKADDELTPRQLYLRNWWRDNRGRYREQRDEWRANNLELARATNRDWARKNRERMAESNARYAASTKGRYTSLVRTAAERGHELELSQQEWFQIATLPCAYCGEPGLSAPTGYGIDRIDSSLGYTKENSAPCCRDCNYMKSNFSADEFMMRVLKIVAYLDRNADAA